jgi:hypothetical protein
VSSTGQVLVGYRSNTGQEVVMMWSSTGQVVVKYWSSGATRLILYLTCTPPKSRPIPMNLKVNPYEVDSQARYFIRSQMDIHEDTVYLRIVDI